MADVWEKDLAQKSSLTTSDFIRVVGSDNVSYKQGMQSVSDNIIKLASKTGSGDANNLTTAGMYWCNGANVSHLPDTTNYYRVRVEMYSGAVNQYANRNGTREMYFRTLANNTWAAWAKLPTRAEIDALNSKADVYHIEYAATASTSGTRYYSPSISAALDLIAAKGPGRYMAECARNSSYSDTYNNITTANMTLIVDVLGVSYINVIGIQLHNANTSDILIKRAKTSTWGDWIKMPTRAEVDALNSKTSTYITDANYKSVLATFSTTSVVPVFVHQSLMTVIYGITGINGTGLCIRHTSSIFDFVFFDTRIRLVRYNIDTDTFSRKYHLDMIAE